MRCAALFTCMLLLAALARGEEAGQTHAPAIAIHGGAGTIAREAMTPEREARILLGLYALVLLSLLWSPLSQLSIRIW